MDFGYSCGHVDPIMMIFRTIGTVVILLLLSCVFLEGRNLARESLSLPGKNLRKIAAGMLCGLMPSVANAELVSAPWSERVQYEILKQAPAGALQPKVGDLVAIRFRGSYKGTDFDNTFKNELPYFYRAGTGLIVKGLDDTVVNMHVGDRFHVTFGGDLAFGEKGRPSAPGKPRIPPNAAVDYEVELVELPGTEEEFIADVDE